MSAEFQKNHEQVMRNIEELRELLSAEMSINRRHIDSAPARISKIEEFLRKTIETLTILARQDVDLNNALCE